MARPKPVFLLLALCLAAPASSAQLVDALMRPFDLFTGEIEADDDIDLVSIDTLAGSTLTIIVGPAKKSPFVPSVLLIDTSDDSVLAQGTATKKRLTLKTDPLPTTGTYLIRITGDAGSTGGYTLRWREKLAKSAKKVAVDETVDSGAVFEIPFDAANEFELTARLQRLNKKSAADPAEPTLHAPDDGELVIDPTLVKPNKAGDRFTLRKVPLDATGTWTLAALNEGFTGELRARLALKRQRFKRRVLEELPLGATGAPTLSGTVRGSFFGIEPLVGALVTLAPDDPLALGSGESQQTLTDDLGRFVFEAPITGHVLLTLDGSGVDLYPANTVRLFLPDDEPTDLSQAFVLQRFSAGFKSLILNGITTSGGSTLEAIDATNPTNGLAYSGPVGTTISVDGLPFSGEFSIYANVQDARDVLVPLPPGEDGPLDACAYVSVEPAGARFLVGTGFAGAPLGLDLTLPNARGFAPGTSLDVWAFEPESAAWVDVTDDTGIQAVVSPDGLTASAPGALRHGGVYAFATTQDPDCITTLIGTVMDGGGLPVPGVSVRTTLGVVGQTDVNGDFSLPLHAYDPGALPACVGAPVFVTLHTGAALGSQQSAFSAGVVVPGSVTDLGTLALELPLTGLVAGRVVDNGVPVQGGTVELSGPTTVQVITDSEGRLLVPDLIPGSYQASHLFTGADEPTTVAFTVAAQEIVPIALQRAGGQGSQDVTVTVLRDPGDPTRPFEPAAGATVVLVGSDPFSSAGLQADTNQDGAVLFTDVDPPYDVTAVLDVQRSDGTTGRFAASLLAVEPSGDAIGLPLPVTDAATAPEGEGLLTGVVTNVPDDTFDVEYVHTVHVLGTDPTQPFLESVEVDSFDGFWELPVPLGLSFHVVLRQTTFDFTDFPDEDIFVSGALPALGVAGPLVVDGSVSVPFDVEGAGFVPFDQPVTLDWQGLPAPSTVETLGLSLCARALDQGVDDLPLFERLDEVFGDSGYTPPGVLRLPDPAHPGLAGLTTSLGAEVTATGASSFQRRGASCRVPLAAADDALVLALPSAPLLMEPGQDDAFFLNDFATAPIQVNDQTSGGDQGTTAVTLTSQGALVQAALGVDVVSWTLTRSLGGAQLGLPPSPLTLLVEADWEAQLSVRTWEGSTLDFDGLFDDDVEARLASLADEASSLCVGLTVNAFELLPR